MACKQGSCSSCVTGFPVLDIRELAKCVLLGPPLTPSMICCCCGSSQSYPSTPDGVEVTGRLLGHPCSVVRCQGQSCPVQVAASMEASLFPIRLLLLLSCPATRCAGRARLKCGVLLSVALSRFGAQGSIMLCCGPIKSNPLMLFLNSRHIRGYLRWLLKN